MQPAPDPITRLHHHTRDPGMRQRVRDSQSRDPRADHHHPLYRASHPTRHVRSTIVIRPAISTATPLLLLAELVSEDTSSARPFARHRATTIEQVTALAPVAPRR